MSEPSIRVEFYGIARQRAGVAEINLNAETLATACRRLRERLPAFAESCLQGDALKPGYLASINGRTFTTDPETTLTPGDSLLILSSDAGG